VLLVLVPGPLLLAPSVPVFEVVAPCFIVERLGAFWRLDLFVERRRLPLAAAFRDFAVRLERFLVPISILLAKPDQRPSELSKS
jgi:hypothetical protein